MPLANLKRFVPRSLKSRVNAYMAKRRLRAAISKIRSLSVGQTPSRKLLTELISGWNNEGFVANIDYLEEVANRANSVTGPILECGTGVTTILLGLLGAKRSLTIWSLEHSHEWQQKITAWLKSNKIENVHVCFSPMKEYGEYDWYQPPLDQMPQHFALVICDGPPGNTKGGRYGLLPLFGDRLSAESIILLDDANRPDEKALIERWKNEVNLSSEIIESANHGYAVLRRL